MLRANVAWRQGEKVGVAFARQKLTVDPSKANELSHRLSRVESEVLDEAHQDIAAPPKGLAALIGRGRAASFAFLPR